MRRSRTRGFTLAETLVSLMLLVLLLVLTWQVVSPSLRIYQINQARTDVEQTGLLVQYKMTRELQQTDPSSITFNASNPPALSFLAFDETAGGGYDTSTGAPVWQKYVIYYLDADNKILYRKEWPNAGVAIPDLPAYTFPMTTPQPLGASDLRSICSTENGTESRAAFYVMGLSVTNPMGSPVQLQIQLSEDSPDGSEVSVRQASLLLRN